MRKEKREREKKEKELNAFNEKTLRTIFHFSLSLKSNRIELFVPVLFLHDFLSEETLLPGNNYRAETTRRKRERERERERERVI